MNEKVGTQSPTSVKPPAPRMTMDILQRVTENDSSIHNLPPIVHEVLHSPGQPLDRTTRAYMEPRFGHDFSNVRVHTDAKATESASAVNALAYTVGHDMVFGTGQYVPQSSSGQRLIAHELTHIMQQAATSQNLAVTTPIIGLQDPIAEVEATRNADNIVAGRTMMVGTPMAVGTLQRRPSPIDAVAQAIITAAADTTRPLANRAVEVVQRIINQYYAGDASKVSSIRYQDNIPGLSTTYQGTGQTLTGIITVGRYFVENTNRTHFERRVAQVGHEIEHINQQRAGMGGANRQDEREFRAFYHEALFVERAGTGRMQHSTRVSLIDAALGHYNCMDATLQANFATQRQELLTRRQAEVTASGNPAPPLPTSCRRQP